MAQSSGRNITRICRADQRTNNDGNEEVPGEPGAKSAANGVKIVFSEGEAPKKAICYFSTDLTNAGVKNSGFLAFCDSSALPTASSKARHTARRQFLDRAELPARPQRSPYPSCSARDPSRSSTTRRISSTRPRPTGGRAWPSDRLRATSHWQRSVSSREANRRSQARTNSLPAPRAPGSRRF